MTRREKNGLKSSLSSGITKIVVLVAPPPIGRIIEACAPARTAPQFRGATMEKPHGVCAGKPETPSGLVRLQREERTVSFFFWGVGGRVFVRAAPGKWRSAGPRPATKFLQGLELLKIYRAIACRSCRRFRRSSNAIQAWAHCAGAPALIPFDDFFQLLADQAISTQRTSIRRRDDTRLSTGARTSLPRDFSANAAADNQ